MFGVHFSSFCVCALLMAWRTSKWKVSLKLFFVAVACGKIQTCRHVEFEVEKEGRDRTVCFCMTETNDFKNKQVKVVVEALFACDEIIDCRICGVDKWHWMHACTNECTNECMNECANECTNESVNARMIWSETRTRASYVQITCFIIWCHTTALQKWNLIFHSLVHVHIVYVISWFW